MTVPLRKRQKLVLLRRAWRKGPGPFMRQAILTFGSSVLWRRHLIYEAHADKVLKLDIPDISDILFREVRSWNELSPDIRECLLRDKASLGWGDEAWFDLGWQLWVGEVDGRLATLAWWRTAEQSNDFFIPVPEDTELMWQSTTMPEFRGRDLFTVQQRTLMQRHAQDGVRRFLSCCEDFNMTSRRNLPRQGFDYIGMTVKSRLTGKRRWYPARQTR